MIKTFYFINSAAISSQDFPLVSGINSTPNAAFNKHISPKVTMQLKRPNISSIVGKIDPRMNNVTHIIDTANAKHVWRI